MNAFICIEGHFIIRSELKTELRDESARNQVSRNKILNSPSRFVEWQASFKKM